MAQVLLEPNAIPEPELLQETEAADKKKKPEEMTTATADDTSSFWAYDSKGQELDPQMKPAHQTALDSVWPLTEAERTEPIILRQLLSEEQIEVILQQASAPGVWPRGVVDKEKEEEKNDTSTTSTTEEDDHKPLQHVPHHFAWTNNHAVLYMHNPEVNNPSGEDYWFVRACPEAWAILRGGMEAGRHDLPGVPVLDELFAASEETLRSVRTIELHHYAPGGGLLNPGHLDCGSELTLSVLLSDPETVEGGDFVTYNTTQNDRGPVCHDMQRGDAILFASEKFHNISTVTQGVRQSLVVELWPTKLLY